MVDKKMKTRTVVDRRVEGMVDFFRPCARWKKILHNCIIGHKPTPHGINTARTHDTRYTTHPMNLIFGEREGGKGLLLLRGAGDGEVVPGTPCMYSAGKNGHEYIFTSVCTSWRVVVVVLPRQRATRGGAGGGMGSCLQIAIIFCLFAYLGGDRFGGHGEFHAEAGPISRHKLRGRADEDSIGGRIR